MFNRKFFFDHVRSNLFAGKLSARQVAGMTFILDVWEASHAAKDDRWVAYALGTTFHETAFTMQPIKEFGGDTYFRDRYDPKGKKPHIARDLGNTKPGDGVMFHGRGYVQLTGRRNYTAMQKAFGGDLTSSRAAADGVLEPKLAAKIMFKGMEEGIFTGKKFKDYFAGTKQDWVNARRIINGLDHAAKIASYAKDFYAALSHTT
jgi:hypothetical protein